MSGATYGETHYICLLPDAPHYVRCNMLCQLPDGTYSVHARFNILLCILRFICIHMLRPYT
jgi:hypothetical protein